MSCLRRGLTAHALAAQGSAGWLKVLIGFGTFCWVTVASVGLGLLSGALSAIITRWWWIRGVVHAEILVLAALPYMTYVGAEALDVSGIMSLFVCGMMVRQPSHTTILGSEPLTEAAHHDQTTRFQTEPQGRRLLSHVSHGSLSRVRLRADEPLLPVQHHSRG